MTALANPYAMTLVAEAPALTLATAYLQLLPLALIAGFQDISLKHSVGRYGAQYGAWAHRSDTSVETLACLLDHRTLAEMVETATESLYCLMPAFSSL